MLVHDSAAMVVRCLFCIPVFQQYDRATSNKDAGRAQEKAYHPSDDSYRATAASVDHAADAGAFSAGGVKQQQQVAVAVQQLRLQLLEVQGVVGQGFAVLCGKLKGMMEAKASSDSLHQVGWVGMGLGREGWWRLAVFSRWT